MSNKKTYEMLAEAFMQENIGPCFALLGDANMKWGAHLAALGGDFVYVRHEHCAVAAAMAYARKTGDVGVASVTNGPGLTQILTALPAAVRAHLPVVIFAGESPLRTNWYNQEIDQAPFVKACGVSYYTLHHPESMLQKVRDAFLEARTKRVPVVVGVPFDLQAKDWPLSDELPPASHVIMPKVRAIPPNDQDVDDAVALIKQSKRIVIMAGLGAVESNAGPECRQLAEQVGGLLSTTLPARGLFHDDPFNLNVVGGFSSDVTRECLLEADLIIAVGASLASHNSAGGKLYSAEKVLQIDTSPAAISQGRHVASQHICADAKLGVAALVKALQGQDGLADSWRTPELAQRIKETPPDSTPFPAKEGVLDPRDVVKALDEVLPTHWQMVNSSGHCSYFFAHMNNRPAETFLTIREFGAIGNGTSFAMGVAAARPNETIVLFDGDGSLLMHIQELETMVRHNMNILICVLNDGAYGSEVHKLRASNLLENGTVFGFTDLAKIAQGFGVEGHVVDNLNDLPALLGEFKRLGGLAVWDIRVSDQVTSPVMRAAHPTLEPSRQ